MGLHQKSRYLSFDYQYAQMSSYMQEILLNLRVTQNPLQLSLLFSLSSSRQCFWTDWQKVEFSSSATKNIISPLSRCLWLTKLGRVVTYHPVKGLPPVKLHEPLITWSSNISWQIKFIINSTTRVVMTTKLGKMVAHLNGLLPIKSYDPMITWYCSITWQAKTIISPLLQCL